MSEQANQPTRQLERDVIATRVQQEDFGIIRPVGDESVAIITRLSISETSSNINQEFDPEAGPTSVGNVLRRTCIAIGESACKDGCALNQGFESFVGRQGSAESFEYLGLVLQKRVDKECTDQNLETSLVYAGIASHNLLMIAVTGNQVGFADEIETYRSAGKLKENERGWSELPGFNAFFSRPDNSREVSAIGSRLADCAHLEFEFKDRDGQIVIGFEHGTRPNMSGTNQYAFEIDGQPVSYTEYVMKQAIEHYGADPESFKMRLSSSIKPENFVKHFDSIEKMENHIPGWLADGFVQNISNLNWKTGDLVVKEDEWQADARGLILQDIYLAMKACGIPHENFVHDDMLDPADSNGEFSSYENRSKHGDTRDLYLVAHKSAFTL